MSTGSSKSLTVAEAATRYLHSLNGEAQRQSQPEINRFVRWLGSSRILDNLSSHEVASYANSLGTTTTDVANKLEPVKSFLAWAKKEGYTASNLSTSLRPPKTSTRTSTRDRQVSSRDPASLTQEGHATLLAELEGLKAERPKIAQTLRLAMADKDFRENAPLDAAREQQALVEARIRELESVLKGAQVMRPGQLETRKVQLGNTVVLWDVDNGEALRFTLVHPNEVNLAQGKISAASPIGKAILDRTAGEEVTVLAPAGANRYKIQAVESGA